MCAVLLCAERIALSELTPAGSYLSVTKRLTLFYPNYSFPSIIMSAAFISPFLSLSSSTVSSFKHTSTRVHFSSTFVSTFKGYFRATFSLAPSQTFSIHPTTFMTAASKSASKPGGLRTELSLPNSFAKYHGIGNDFFLIDNREAGSQPILTPEQSAKLCDRHTGLGADGVIFLCPGDAAQRTDFAMRIFNSDGSEPEMCGNGIRCLAKYAFDIGVEMKYETNKYRIHTLAGLIVPEILPSGQVKVDMGQPILQADKVPCTLKSSEENGWIDTMQVDGLTWQVTPVSMGNPHCITFIDQALAKKVDAELERIGPMFETHPAFPKKTNTEFIYILSPSECNMTVWERGAGRTLACGTGACAVVVAGVLRKKLDRHCLVHLPGGDLTIEWSEKDSRVYMTGPAELIYSF